MDDNSPIKLKTPSKESKKSNRSSSKKRVRNGRVNSRPSVDFIKNPIFTCDENLEIFKVLEARAHLAINNKRVFTVIGGFDVLRQSLIGRGWIEKIPDVDAKKIILDEKVISETVGNYDTTRMVLSQLVKSSPTYFIWQPKHYEGFLINIHHPYRNRINRMRFFDFTLKEGLHNMAENIQWHIIEDLTELNYPRSYLLMDLYQRDYFQQEFRRSLITSFIFFVNDNFDSLFTEDGTMSVEIIFNCLQRVEQYVKAKQHLCIDMNKMNNSISFNEISRYIEMIVHEEKKFKKPDISEGISLQKLKENVKIATAEIHVYWPDTTFDGHFNLWILKPINRSRGFGVVVMRDVEKIFDHVIRHVENKYIVQKYIERPLLIYKTKFDIRIYFLTVVTKTSVNIWCYKDCYLKFSSQEFSLKNLHESIHLTNNSIQRFYSNGLRDQALPCHNMWLLKDFKNYLKIIDKPNMWEEKIYPSIKKNLLAIILASLEDTDLEYNTFELNGSDFLISDDFIPILLEINANPDLTFTTKTTKDICPRVMEDVVKVIVDLPNDSTTSTGDFELIYEIMIERASTPSQKLQLNIDGKKILPPVRTPRQFFPFRNITELVIKGEKLFNPLKGRYRPPIIVKRQRQVDSSSLEIKQRRGGMKKVFKPTKLYRNPATPRSIFQNIVVKPCSTEIVSYVKKLPSFLQSTNRKFINLNDLMRYLKIE